MSKLRDYSIVSSLFRNPGEWGAILGWALVIVVVLAAAIPLDAFTQFGPGPGFFPRALCVALAVLVVAQAAVLARSHVGHSGIGDQNVNRATAANDTTLDDDGARRSRHGAVVRFTLMVACLFAYAVLLEPLGFVLATAALGYSILVLLGRPPLRALAESIIATLVLRFAFATLLNVQLPESGVEFLRSIGL
jgi:hypothetical protein